MGLRHQQAPAGCADPLDIARHVALFVLTILQDPRFVAERERAEEHITDRVARKDQADVALDTAQLAKALQGAFGPNAAAEAGIGDIVEVSGLLRAGLNHPAAV